MDMKEQAQRLKIQAAEFRQELPRRQKDVADHLRLIALARQAPFAGANVDFLDRLESTWKERETQNKVLVSVLEAVDKVDL